MMTLSQRFGQSLQWSMDLSPLKGTTTVNTDPRFKPMCALQFREPRLKMADMPERQTTFEASGFFREHTQCLDMSVRLLQAQDSYTHTIQPSWVSFILQKLSLLFLNQK